MNTITLIQRLHKHKILLTESNGKLLVDSPKGSLTEEFSDLIRINKEGIVNFLKEQSSFQSCVTNRQKIKKIPRSLDSNFHLSFAQQRLWLIDRMEGGSSLYNLPMALRVDGVFNIDTAEQAMKRIIRRHEPLRTVFAESKGVPVQIIRECFDFTLTRHDLCELDKETQDKQVDTFIRQDVLSTFDLSAGLMVRGAYILLSDTKGSEAGVLLFNMHHISSDGWSMGVLVDEFVTQYQAILRGEPDPLTPLAIQYADYAHWQREWLAGDVLDNQLSYWQQQLADVLAVHSLPLDYPRQETKQHQGGVVFGKLSAEISQRLQQLALEQGVTPFMLLHAALGLVLSRHSNSQDIVIGTPVANRLQAELEPLIGFFVNTLVLRTTTDHELFSDYLVHVRQVNLDAQANQDVPFEHLVEHCNVPRSTQHTPLFQILLTMNTNQLSELSIPGVRFSPVESGAIAAKFELSISAQMIEGGVYLSWVYDRSLFSEDHIKQFNDHLERLLTNIAESPQALLRDLPMLSPTEIHSLLYERNETQVDYPKDRLIHELFEAQVELNPDQVAVVFEDKQLTYRELNNAANQVAHYLKKRDVGPEILVGIWVERSLDMMIGILGILKAGGAYVPLDPGHPQARLRFMLEDSGVKQLLTQTRLIAELSVPDDINVVALDGEEFQSYCSNNSKRHVLQQSSNLAYVIYTSGSTGKPKGVMVEHKNVVQLVINEPSIKINSNDCVVYCANPAFDASTWEIWIALLNGSKLLIMSQEALLEPKIFAKQLSNENASILQLTAGLFTQYAEHLGDCFSNLRYVLFGGDKANINSVKQVYQNSRPQHLVHTYGPTETVAFTLTYEINAIEDGTNVLPIGRSMANTQSYVLDNHRHFVPQGAIGELYIGGEGVARGYLNSPELTAERFMANTFVDDPNARMYKTGDLVRLVSDGNLEFLGRIDDQVKIRGFRIELTEIQHLLSESQLLSSCLVLAREDEPEQKRLVAYVVAKEAEVLDETKLVLELRESLQQSLPDYMLPSSFVVLDEFPLTPNGKIDKKALPAPDGTLYQQKYIAPSNETERVLVEIWSKLLKLDAEKISITANFFELGGHSLLAVRLVAEIRAELAQELAIKSVFEASTIQGLSNAIHQGSNLTLRQPVTPVERDGSPLPLSFAQQRLWFIDKMNGGSPQYNIPQSIPIKGKFNFESVETAFSRIIQRHEPLRTIFAEGDEGPVQIIQEPVAFKINHIDLSGLNKKEQTQELETLIHAERNQVFNLSADLMLRGTYLHLSSEPEKQQGLLLLTMHHIASDGWSMGLLRKEFDAQYAAVLQDKPDPFKPLAIQYADYAHWQREWLQGEVLDLQLSYWTNQLDGIPQVHNLPLDKTRPQLQSFNGRRYGQVIEGELVSQINAYCQAQDVTMFMFIQTAFAVLLGRYNNEDDIVIGSPVAGRTHQDVESLIGFFVNMLVLRTDLSNDPGFSELLQQNKHLILSAFEHQDIPFEMLVEVLQPERSLSHSSLVQITLTLQNSDKPGRAKSGQLDTSDQSLKFDIELSATITHVGIYFVWGYNTDLFYTETIECMASNFEALLTNIINQPEQRVSQLDLLSETESRRLITEWNQTQVNYPQAQCIHELFEAQALQNPDNIAAVFEGQSLTYLELNQRANRLAHYLIDEEISFGDYVGLCVERSLELLIGIFGVLKTGATYIPFEPKNTKERNAHIIQDAGIEFVLLQSCLSGQVPVAGIDILFIEESLSDPNWLSDFEEINPTQNVGLDDSAYVIYTSGSTGKPKGVEIGHRGLLDYCCYGLEHYYTTDLDGALLITSHGFDIGVPSLFLPLLSGDRVDLLPADDVLTSLALALSGTSCSNYLLRLTPGHVNGLLMLLQGDSYPASHVFVVGGEALSGELASRLQLRFPLSQIYNHYGPTEAVVGCAIYDVSEHTVLPENVPIGRAMANTQLYVLDGQLQVLPRGAIGELHIGGLGVAKGYINQVELTAEKFITNPWIEGGRLFKTGDLVRYLVDGNLEFIGRIDEQVKIRGFRIELGEIENALLAHSAVENAIVVENEQNLFAYVIPEQTIAHPVRRLIQLDCEAKWDTIVRKALPNGMLVGCLNEQETEFTYKEIFEEQTYLRHGIRLRENANIFDVGANTGMFSLFVSQVCPTATIMAFEPIPSVFNVLEFNSALYDLNTQLYCCGLSNKAQDVVLTFYPHNSLISSRYGKYEDDFNDVKTYLKNEHHEAMAAGELSETQFDELLTERLNSEQVECQLQTISQIIEDNHVTQIDLLKIDVQKSEMDVLAGIADKDWAKIKQIVIEVHDIGNRLSEMEEILKTKGFRWHLSQEEILKGASQYVIYAIHPSYQIKGQELIEEKSLPTKYRWSESTRLINELKSALGSRLPSHMVPSVFTVMDEFPLTPNGKIDKKALPAPDGTLYQEEYIAPSNETEKVLVEIWAKLLKLDEDKIGVTSNFFELGGHSLLAVRLVAEIRTELAQELAIKTIFESPTVQGLSNAIHQGSGLTLRQEVIPVNRDGSPLSLSFAQQRLWFIDKMNGGSPEYNMPQSIPIKGKFNLEVVETAFSRIIQRHEPLRTIFGESDEGPVQVIQAGVEFKLNHLDLSGLDKKEQNEQVKTLVLEEHTQVFDLSYDLMLRGTYLHLSSEPNKERGLLLLTMHHIASDGWSMGLLRKEFDAQYSAVLEGQPDPLEPLAIQYADYAHWQREWLSGEVLEGQLNYWMKQLEEVPAVHSLPLDYPRPEIKSHQGASVSEAISVEVSQQLLQVANQYQVTPFMLIHGALALVLSRHSNSNDIVIGTPVANRMQVELEPLIGFFVNTLVLRANTDYESFEDYITQIKAINLDAQANQDVPFENLVERCQVLRSRQHTPLFQILLNMNTNEGVAERHTSQKRQPSQGVKWHDEQLAKFDLAVHVQLTQSGGHLSWKYDKSIFTRAHIEILNEHLQRLLTGLAETPASLLQDLPMLSKREIHYLTRELNDTQMDYPKDKLIHKLFEDQAAQSPDNIALVFEDKQLTYRELNERANQLAHYLVEQGVKSDTLVGLCVERSFEMVVSVFAILKSGGAYVPLDVQFKPEIIKTRVGALAPKLVITSALTDVIFQEIETLKVNLEHPDIVEKLSLLPKINPISLCNSINLAYVLTTSGTTGEPKLIGMPHQSLVNLISGILQDCPELKREHSVLQFSSIGFDMSFTDMCLALLQGGTLNLINENEQFDVKQISNVISKTHSSLLNLPYAMLQSLATFSNEAGIKFDDLSVVISTAERLLITPEIRSFFNRHKGVKLVNHFGPSETHVCTTHILGEDSSQWPAIPSIGRPLNNVKCYVMTKSQELVPFGAVGELYVGGECLARGYIGQAALTQEKFVNDPYDKSVDTRLYRTGDLVRWSNDGELEYIGRADSQIKLRGFRIEIGAIESALRSHADVRENCVIYDEKESRLIAYIVGDEINLTELQSHMAQIMPYYMLPGYYVVLDALPINANGKIDKKALPAPDGSLYQQEYIAPSSDTERVLVDIWAKLLKLDADKISVTVNFFELGGHSLLAVRLMAKLQEALGEIVQVVSIFDAPTIKAFAIFLEQNYVNALYRKGLLNEQALAAYWACESGWRLKEKDLAMLKKLVPIVPAKTSAKKKRKKNSKAVFILSAPRSGSTLLRVMLAGHSKLFAPAELELLAFDSLSQRREAFSGRFKFWLEGALSALMEIKDCSLAQAQQIMDEYEKQGLSTQQFYQQLQDDIGDSILLDKTPSYAYHPAILAQAEACFEEVHYIYLARHPYGMINSFEKAQLDQVLYLNQHDYTTRQLGELIWTSCQLNIQAFLKDIPQSRQHAIQFEQLVAEPEAEMRALCDFLAIDYDEALLAPYDNNSARMVEGVHQGSRMLGDVKFQDHGKIRASVGEAWKKNIKQDFLSERSWQLAEGLDYRQADFGPLKLKRIETKGERPLSFAQQRLWFIDKMNGGSPEYNMPQSIPIKGLFNLEAVETAFSRIIQRHEPLRTIFGEGDEGPVQIIQEAIAFKINHIDLSDLDKKEQNEQVKTLVLEERNQVFDLSCDLMLRGTYLHLSKEPEKERGLLLLTMHHIASDGWSMGLLRKEFDAQYAAILQDKPDPLEPLAIQYADYAHWQREWLRGEVLEGQLNYWMKQLDEVPAVHSLPLDYPRPEIKSHQGASISQAIPAALSQQLLQVAIRYQVTPFMLMHGALALLLSRHSNSNDIVMGTPVANRMQVELEPLIGFFVNTLVLRANTDYESFSDYIAQIKAINLDAQANQDVPFENLVERCQIPRSMQHMPLFQIMLNMNTNEGVAERSTNQKHQPSQGVKWHDEQVAKFDLTVNVQLTETGGDLSWTYDTSLFTHEHIETLSEHLNRLLTGIAEAPNSKLCDLPMLSAKETHYLLNQLNDTKTDYPQDKLIHELFEAQAEQTPDNIAVVFEDKQLTYQELNQAANRLAHYLREQGVEAETLVGICVDRSLEMIVGILGILKAGGAYVPLDPNYPQARLDYILQDTNLKVLLTHSSLLKNFNVTEGIQLIELDTQTAIECLQAYSSLTPKINISQKPSETAYVTYTSGSTGKPKGVLTPHLGVIRLVTKPDFIELNESTRFLQHSSISFDAATLEIWGALLNGGSSVLYPEQLVDLVLLNQTVEQKQINTLWLTAGLFEQWSYVARNMNSLRWVLAGGDIVEPGAVYRVLNALPKVLVINGYGPTEATTFTCCYPILSTDNNATSIPVGRPINGTSLYVLSTEEKLTPPGSVGELYIGGAGLANGYLNQPELTAKRFIPNPFSDDPQDRLYKTGDLVRYLPDGNLDFIGRVDDQVKIRGFRIELGEIESQLSQCKNVTACTVLARKDEPGQKRLVAYVVAEEAETLDETKLVSELRDSLQKILPDYMLPSAFVILDKFPLTPNGKIDRKSLPAPDGRHLQGEYIAPESESEKALVKIWAKLLKLDADSISVTANFFELGGHSLLAIRLIALIKREFLVEPMVKTIFEIQTLSELLVSIENALIVKKSEEKPNELEIEEGWI